MIALARWAMDSRRQALIATTVSMAFPLLFWLGAALIALIVMREGEKEGRSIAFWAVLPTFAWLAMGDATPLIVLLGSFFLATIVRQSNRLDWAMMMSAGIGIVVYFLLPSLLPEVLPLVISNSEDALTQGLQQRPEIAAQLQPLVAPIVQGVLAALHVLIFILCLLLGRYWHSELDHPGGFGTEFKQLRLSPWFALLVVLAVLTSEQMQPQLVGLLPLLTVPVALAGLAVFHGVVTITKASSTWMVVFYAAFLVLGPYMYTLLIFVALLDTLINIRTRLKDTAS